MHDPRLSELAAELDRVAEDAAGEGRPGDAISLLRFAAELRHLQRLTGDATMGKVADTLHAYKQAFNAEKARADAAVADRQKDAADLQRFKDLEAAGQILDPADVAALAEPAPGSDAAPPAAGATTTAGGDTANASASGGTAAPAAPTDGSAPQNANPGAPATDAAGNPLPPTV